MKIAITICVPSATREFANWGDLYYAESMRKEFQLCGLSCKIYCMDQWQIVKDDELIIHLRGLKPYITKRKSHSYLWIINHPELITKQELDGFSRIYCASQLFTDLLNKQEIKASFLPQAGDAHHFFPIEGVKKTIDVLFVGNNHLAEYGQARKIVSDVLSQQIDFNFKVVGAAWRGVVPESQILAEFVEWKDLNQLYQSSKIVLNDHQQTMHEYGFINNRTFDLMMANQFQIADQVYGMDDFGIETYLEAKELHQKINMYLNDEALIVRSNKIVNQLSINENFESRVKSLIGDL